MHLVVGENERIDDGEAAIDLAQSAGDIIVLSAADSELAAFAAALKRDPAGPTVRLANWMRLTHPYSVDLYLEKTAASAKLVILRMMGGSGYWPYGLEALRALSRGGGPKLVVVPGEDRWDPGLEAYSTVPIPLARRIWRFCVEAGPANIGRALALARHTIGHGEDPGEPQPLPELGFWSPGSGLVGREAALAAARRRPYALIVFYRALIEGGSMAPVDGLVAALAEKGLGAVPVFVTSLKNGAVVEQLAAFLDEAPPAIVLNGTAFAISKPGRDPAPTVLDAPGRPVLQIVFAGTSREAWTNSARGLSPRDLIMNVALPEVDGRILTRTVSFKEEVERDDWTDSRIVAYRPDPERIGFVASLADAWVRLAQAPPEERRVAIVLSNYPGRDGRIGNGVGLDTPEGAARIVAALADEGYHATGFPETGRGLMDLLLGTEAKPAVEPSPPTLHADETPLSNSPPQGGRGQDGASSERLPLAAYRAFHDALPEAVRSALAARWGAPEADPLFEGGAFRVRVRQFGNVVIAVQPGRGYGVDPKSTYHDPELVPPHHYLAFYAWLREAFGAHAILQLGKHGNLEWLPGKALGLSAECWPEVALGATPLIYPFIVNDPGEGAQAKRRSAAVIVDHLMPALTRAGTQGVFAEIETLIDEYHLAAGADLRRRDYIEREILALAARHGIDRDLAIGRDDASRALRAIDAHLCDLKELQIRDGLHRFGDSPAGEARIDTLLAIARVPRSGGRPENASLQRAIAADLGLAGFDPLTCDRAEDWTGPKPAVLEAFGEGPWRTAGDAVERIEALASEMVADALPLPRSGGGSGWGPTAEPSTEALPAQQTPLSNSPPQGGRGLGIALHRGFATAAPILDWITTDLAPALDRSGAQEIAAVLAALAGRFVPPGPSGAPSRGRPDVLPTGRNFYAVDTRAVPTEAAWQLGRRAAEALVQRYLQDEGEWPRSIAISAWGTANMRTGGDDIAQVLALIGAEPVWEPGTGRVTGFRVLSLSELKRPRVDVTLRISGMFCDAFPEQIDLIDSAVRAIAARDEPDEANPIAAASRREQHASRIFGARPGSYGAGLQTLIDHGIWQDRAELAEAFVAWSGYAYGAGVEGEGREDRLRARLAGTDAILQNQDNREHDILDSDEYYQFQGGLALSVEAARGSAPRLYHGDHSLAENPVVRPLSEEIGRIVRGRAANPKWIAGCRRHGYKGASEMAASVDFLFGYAATTHAVGDHHFDALYEAYLADDEVRAFIADANPPALSEIADRFAEAIDRGLWSPRLNSVHARLDEYRSPRSQSWKETA